MNSSPVHASPYARTAGWQEEIMKPLAVAIVLTLSMSSRAESETAIESYAPISPFVEDTIARGGSTVGFGFRSFWIESGARLSRIDAFDDSVVDIKLGNGSGACRNLAEGEGALWVPDCGLGVIHKIDPHSNEIVLRIEVNLFSHDGSIAAGYGSVW